MSIPAFAAGLAGLYALTLAVALAAIPGGRIRAGQLGRRLFRLVFEPESYDALASGLVWREIASQAAPVIRARRIGLSWRWPRPHRRSMLYRPRHSY
jgi:hypothetical protein